MLHCIYFAPQLYPERGPFENKLHSFIHSFIHQSPSHSGPLHTRGVFLTLAVFPHNRGGFLMVVMFSSHSRGFPPRYPKDLYKRSGCPSRLRGFPLEDFPSHSCEHHFPAYSHSFHLTCRVFLTIEWVSFSFVGFPSCSQGFPHTREVVLTLAGFPSCSQGFLLTCGVSLTLARFSFHLRGFHLTCGVSLPLAEFPSSSRGFPLSCGVTLTFTGFYFHDITPVVM